MIAYFDCFAGASGDMLVGALLDLGVDRSRWLSQIEPLVPDRWHLNIEKISKQGFAATKFSVWENGKLAEDPHTPMPASHLVFRRAGACAQAGQSHRFPGAVYAPEHDHSHVHHSLAEVLGHLARARLSGDAAALARKVFLLLAECEASVHGSSVESVHFHEVGATDAVIDIAGFAAAFCELGIAESVVSHLVTGNGTVQTSHGVLPVPPPVVLEIIRRCKAPVRSSSIPFEALTPTGAALLCTIADAFGPHPDMKRVCAVGYGAGTREGIGTPNVIRVTIGEKS